MCFVAGFLTGEDAGSEVKYVVNGTEAKGVMCPNCGSESLVYQDGNLICKECGEIR